MSHRPLLSVIVPTYNRADFLPQAVESALNQTGVEVEVIVVDDGSTDQTAEVIEQKRALWGKRVRYIWQKNSERSVARNHGLKYASGDYVTFLDSDDVWQPEHAVTCVTALEADKDAAVAYSEYGLISADGGVIRDCVTRPQSEGKSFQKNICLKRLILHPTEVVIRRSAIGSREVFDPEIPGAEDWLLWVQLAKKAKFLSTGKSTVWMRLHPKGTFGDPQKFTRSLMRAAEKVIATGLPEELGISSKRILAINRIHCAYAYYLSADQSQAWGWLISAIKKYPAAAITELNTWQVLGRLCVGPKLSKRIRDRRQRPRKAAHPVPGN
jgi:glycosyltransferase involved in cell wall biosynthesis